MRICSVSVLGIAPYSASRAHQAEKLPKETHDAYEERTWMQKAHVCEDQIFIPPMAFKFAVDRASKMLGRQIPGKGKATYTKFFESGIFVSDNVVIGSLADMECERVYCNADGVRGSGKRVFRKFPKLTNWKGEIAFHIIADEITPDIFEEAVKSAGLAVGVGRFRPEKGGYFGRFVPNNFAWSQI